MGNPGKPRVAVFTFGGTIAMQATPGQGVAQAPVGIRSAGSGPRPG